MWWRTTSTLTAAAERVAPTPRATAPATRSRRRIEAGTTPLAHRIDIGTTCAEPVGPRSSSHPAASPVDELPDLRLVTLGLPDLGEKGHGLLEVAQGLLPLPRPVQEIGEVVAQRCLTVAVTVPAAQPQGGLGEFESRRPLPPARPGQCEVVQRRDA